MAKRLAFGLLNMATLGLGACVAVGGYAFDGYRLAATSDASSEDHTSVGPADALSSGQTPWGSVDGAEQPFDAYADACTPGSCGVLHAECGMVASGCGDMIDCGTCADAATVCDQNQCSCMPKTCGSIGANCGKASDGCGGMLDCGTCGSTRACVANVCKKGN